MKKLISIIIAAALLTACNNSSSSRSDLTDVKEDISNHSFSSHDNLIFDCEPEPLNADEVYIITTKGKKWKSCDESSKDVLKKYVDDIYDTNINKRKMNFLFEWTEEEIKNGKADDSIEHFYEDVYYVDGILGGSFNAASNTFVVNNYGEYSWGHGEYPMKLNATYSPGEIPKDAYDMFDGSKLTLDEAIKQADEYIKKIEPLFNDGASYRLRKILVEDYPNKGSVFDLRYEHVFFGLPVSDSGFDMFDEQASFPYAPYIEVKLLGDRNLALLSNSHYDLIDKKEKVDKLITLSEAEKLASEKLAKNVKGTVKNAALKYVCITNHQEKVHTYRPMWCFTLEEYEPDFVGMNLFRQRSVFVDAVDSKVYYSDGVSYTLAEE